MSEKPTPLTDKEAIQTNGTPLAHYVRADFARDLERQLAEARTALDQWAKVPFGGEERRFIYARRLALKSLARIDAAHASVDG